MVPSPAEKGGGLGIWLATLPSRQQKHQTANQQSWTWEKKDLQLEGQKRLTLGDLLLYSGHEQETIHTQGVALMLSKWAQRALTGWEAHGLWIIITSICTVKKRIKLDLSNATPQHTTVKRRRGTIIHDRPKKNILLIMGNFNT